MGLDTSHDCWHGGYISFTRWRNRVAEAAGYAVRPVTYRDGMTIDTADIPWGAIERDNPDVFRGQWRVPPVDVLFVLIAHSDCDGVIAAGHCAALADRLEGLLPQLSGDGGGHIGDYRAKTRTFITGLRKAAAAGEDVEFS